MSPGPRARMRVGKTFGRQSHDGCPVEVASHRSPPGRQEEDRDARTLLLAFGVIFVAELGDKSQLMALAFATRYRPLPILIGITIATAVVHAVSVVVGAVLAAQPADRRDHVRRRRRLPRLRGVDAPWR